MVGKLIKNDLKDSSKAYLPVFVMIVVGTVLALLSLSFAEAHSQFAYFITTFMDLVIFGLVIAIMVMSVRATIYVLYSSIYTKNAYRLFTLPVKPWKILVSKIVTSIIWSFLISLLTLASIGIIVGYVSEDFFIIFKGLDELITQLRTMVTPSILAAFLMDASLSTILAYVMILFAGAFTNTSFVRKNRGIITFITVLITASVYGRIADAFGANIFSVLGRYDLNAFFVGTLHINFMEFFWVFAFVVIVISGLIAATLWLWDNKLEITN